MTRRHTILVVADHRGHRRLLADALGSHAEVVEGGDADVAERECDLIVVDDPVLDRTWRVLTWRRAGARPVLLPALVLSARHGAALVAKAHEGAIDDVTTTPVDPGELRVRLETLLAARQTSLELARMHRLVDRLPTGIFHMDATGVLLDVGEGFAEMLAVPSARLVGTNLADHLVRPADAAALVECARAPGSVREFDMMLVRADGAALAVRVLARLAADDRETSVAAVAFARGGPVASGYTVDLVTGSRTPARARRSTV